MNTNNIEGMKARERMLAMRNPMQTTEPTPATIRPAPRRKGRPAKVDQKRQTRPKDAEVFRAAAALLNMTATHDAPKFGVSRQTLSKWMQGVTSAPRSAYVMLLDEVIRAVEAGTANINAVAEARLNKAIDERIAAALKVIEKMNKKGV